MNSVLARILQIDGLLTAADAVLLDEQSPAQPASWLVEEDLVEPVKLTRRLAERLGLAFVDLDDVEVDPSVAMMLAKPLAQRHLALPIRATENGAVVVVMADPSDVYAIDDVRNVVGRDLETVLGVREQIAAAIQRVHASGGEMDELTAEFGDDVEEEADLNALKAATEDAPIVKFVNAIITRAVADRASDIHIEPTEKDLRVRYRIDGVLHEVMTSPRSIHAGVTSRLKIMAELDIAERRVPQDGRIGLILSGKPIDLRVSTLPTVYGEKVVMRILDRTSVLLELSDLGFMEGNFKKFEQSFTKPYGMILVTGPTGSGKSTTLYATMNILNRPEINITTVEDPVEYRLFGINQVPINKKTGMTFSAALRSILRQDPDVVLVGETRDRETAQIAVEAALTGHLVLTTLHTNDAPSAITRLTEMGIEPFLVGSAVDAVLAQRLARRLCGECKQSYQPDPNVMLQAGFSEDEVDEAPTLFRPEGCSRCGGTGYRGRLALHEVMVVDEGIERLTVDRVSSEEIKRYALKEQGLRTLRRDGLDKVKLGWTSIEEIGRVVV